MQVSAALVFGIIANSDSALLRAVLNHAARIEQERIIAVGGERSLKHGQALTDPLEGLGAALVAKLPTPEREPAPEAAYSKRLTPPRPGALIPRHRGVMEYLQRYPCEFG